MASASSQPEPKRLARGLRRAAAFCGAALIVLLGARATQDAVANGDTRTISIRHMHTKEEITVTFKRDGRYVAEGLEKLNWALRDWRIDEPIRMDPRLFDVAWEVHRTVGSEQPFHVVSAYRSPGTNSMLRRRSRGVAKHSQHTLGKAMDFYLPDTPTARIREAGMRMQRGGVGFYPGAHTPFVHMDAGSVRSWPRMTRDQLVRLFPDEKTVHLPADGQPLAGYELAKADIISRGGAVAGYAAADLDEGAVMSSGGRSLWATLFGGDDEEEAARPTRGRPARAKPQPTVMAYANPTASAFADSNSSDGGRFAVAAAPAPDPIVADRSRRLAPRQAEPQPAAIEEAAPAPAIAAAAPQQPARPSMVDAPIPLARPRGLSLPEGEQTQLASLAGQASAFAPATASDAQRTVLSMLPPPRPGGPSLTTASLAALPVFAPLPPSRPGTAPAEPPAEPQGRLVSLDHPLPPGRPGTVGLRPVVAAAVPTPVPLAPATAPRSAAQPSIDRDGLDQLFAAVVQAPAKPAAGVTVTRTRSTATERPVIGAPSPAASLGFRQGAPADETRAFTGPAVRPLPTSFVQN